MTEGFPPSPFFMCSCVRPYTLCMSRPDWTLSCGISREAGNDSCLDLLAGRKNIPTDSATQRKIFSYFLLPSPLSSSLFVI